jgi:site-specific recombinase XerD
MNGLTSIFAAELSEYLAIRGKILAPKSLKINQSVLADFDKYISARGIAEKQVTEDLINGWISLLREINHSRTVSDKVSCLRGFLEYLRYSGVEAFVPRCPKWSEDYVPYIFSDAEMTMIILTADNIAADSDSAMGLAFPMIVRLLYGCGLRLGEALSIIVSDVDFKRGALLIRKAKNNKQRLVPMHETLTKMLMKYCAAMNMTDKPDAFLFPGAKPDSHYSLGAVNLRFRQTLKLANIYVAPQKPGQRGQCLHCLRHLFTIKSFKQAEENGRLTTDSVPYLSVYLGHFDMDGTEKYLKFSSDIFPEHTEMFEAYSAGVFSVMGGSE